jgi:hypothetical protein
MKGDRIEVDIAKPEEEIRLQRKHFWLDFLPTLCCKCEYSIMPLGPLEKFGHVLSAEHR